MASGNGSPYYQFGLVAKAKQDVKVLTARAKQLGLVGELRDALVYVARQLRIRPLTWGDPLFNTKAEGGICYRGMHDLLIVKYVAFEQHRKGFVLRILPVSGHPLSQEES